MDTREQRAEEALRTAVEAERYTGEEEVAERTAAAAVGAATHPLDIGLIHVPMGN